MFRFIVLASLLFLSACAASLPPPAAPSVPLPTPPPKGEPASLDGMSAQALRAAFGEPAFVRKDNGAEIWRYDGPACHAFFFLYARGSAQIVRHVETLPHGETIAADPTCLAALRAQAPSS